MASRPLPVSKLRARRRKRRFIVASMIVALVILLLGVGVGLSWLPWLRVKTVHISGNSAISSESIERDVRSVLAGGYFHLFARDNILLYPREEIRTRLLADFPILYGATIGAENLNTLGVMVSEREPRALWCGSAKGATSACYLIDESGAIFAPAADFGGEVYTVYYGPTTKGTPEQFLTPSQYRTLSASVAALKARVAGDTLESVSIEKEEVHMRWQSGFELIFLLADDGASLLERFNLALSADPFTKHALSDFEYLDLRFGDKLYYKLKNQ